MRLLIKVNQRDALRAALHRALLVLICVVALPAQAQAGTGAAPLPCERQWQLVATHAHDPLHFTQGLVTFDGRLFESVGQYGRSGVHEIDPASGRARRSRQLPETVFGEGLARVGDRLVQLSWRENIAYFYDLSLGLQETRTYPGEGWGLTTLPTPGGERLLLSDGTPWLRVLHPRTLAEQRRVMVTLREQPLRWINELEMVGDELFANVWHSDQVAVINPDSGAVKAWFDFAPLRARLVWPPSFRPSETDLNGLAWDADKARLLVTGKHWPQLFEVQIGGCRPPLPAGP